MPCRGGRSRSGTELHGCSARPPSRGGRRAACSRIVGARAPSGSARAGSPGSAAAAASRHSGWSDSQRRISPARRGGRCARCRLAASPGGVAADHVRSFTALWIATTVHVLLPRLVALLRRIVEHLVGRVHPRAIGARGNRRLDAGGAQRLPLPRRRKLRHPPVHGGLATSSLKSPH